MSGRQIAERSLGALLVCALGFIGYSIVLDSADTAPPARAIEIPLQTTEIEPLRMADTTPLPLPAGPPAAETLFQPQDPVAPADIQDAPVLDAAGRPNAWVIQVGSFAGLEKANALRTRLIDTGYRAYHRRLPAPATERPAQSLYRILVGPYAHSDEAIHHQREIDALLKLRTELHRFQP
ncbi:MAG: SPOR domain-containing protein [Cellvibrionales bacterium]|nr:SPOR domain-containing protein [Cellvibrionales bacterium]